MTQQEKELMNLIAMHDVAINREFNSLANIEFCEALAKAIIAKYPQILAEKVFEDDASIVDVEYLNDWLNKYEENIVQIFIREVK